MVRPDPLPFLGSLEYPGSREEAALCADGREKGPFPTSQGPHQHCMTPAVECLYSAHRETRSSPQETSRNQEKSIKWQIFRAYNRSGSNISGAALGELYSSPASA